MVGENFICPGDFSVFQLQRRLRSYAVISKPQGQSGGGVEYDWLLFGQATEDNVNVVARLA